VNKKDSLLALGGTVFGEQADAAWLAIMETALQCGMTHFDTASGYDNGRSEELIGQFLAAQPGRRDQLFLASKASADEMTAQAILKQVDQSRARLQTELIDLYYIHWPRRGKDLRPWMEGLETARQQGKIGAVGVSNFSVEQMEQVAEVGKIDAHQLGYSLFWRFAERDVIPYCRTHGIALVAYSSLAQGILTGKFPRHPHFSTGDKRPNTVLFADDIWPSVYIGIEQLNALAQSMGRPLAHLALRWVLQQTGFRAAVVGARSPAQVQENASALADDIPTAVFEQMTAISDEVMRHIPDTGNVYRYYP
jgi:aryl-alcohol dehydrogenase-like predicted oxidoreductase